ncbi:hypothetical protein MA16_Dca024994 [Dendrobium catenatum]|uniref:Uncharacterized protein n=1 Tax=Dendrobium catenatum TaxID=906689 RepID=A0A2I0WCS2_9ASPA|nr:hypothetical protein MA16_Dca024994 [Dendrobium catenatum]
MNVGVEEAMDDDLGWLLAGNRWMLLSMPKPTAGHAAFVKKTASVQLQWRVSVLENSEQEECWNRLLVADLLKKIVKEGWKSFLAAGLLKKTERKGPFAEEKSLLVVGLLKRAGIAFCGWQAAGTTPDCRKLVKCRTAGV